MFIVGKPLWGKHSLLNSIFPNRWYIYVHSDIVNKQISHLSVLFNRDL